MHSMKMAVEGSADNPGLSEKLDDDEKETINEAIADGEEWMSSNQDASGEDIKEKHKEVEGVCAPIVSKHYGGSGGSADDDEDEDDDAHDEL
jgi:heat shock protein 5